MTENKGFHAHIYYNAETRPAAEKLRGMLAEKFNVEVGEMREGLIDESDDSDSQRV